MLILIPILPAFKFLNLELIIVKKTKNCKNEHKNYAQDQKIIKEISCSYFKF